MRNRPWPIIKGLRATGIGRLTMPGNVISHAGLQIGNSRLMPAKEMPPWVKKSPQRLGGLAISIVEESDSVLQQTIDTDAKVQGNMSLKDQFYGERSGSLVDPFGYIRAVSTNREELSYEDIQKRPDEQIKTTGSQDLALLIRENRYDISFKD